MKNEEVQVQFTLAEDRKIVLSLNLMITGDSHVDCRELVKNVRIGYPVGWLIIKDHSHQKTNFNLSGVVPYVVIGFKSNGTYSYVMSKNLEDPPVKAEMSGSLFVFVDMMKFITLQGIKHIHIEEKWQARVQRIILKNGSERRNDHDRSSVADGNENLNHSEKDEVQDTAAEIKSIGNQIHYFKKTRFYNQHNEIRVQELTGMIEKLEERRKELLGI